jgi:hypothetical protein
MTWKNLVALLAIAPRRRVIATALVYGLSLSVRFTSATGEEVEIPSQAMTSIVTRFDAPAVYDGLPLKPPQPIALQLGWPLASRGCHAACGRPASTALTPSCAAP